jgi:DNA topoisomerase-3
MNWLEVFHYDKWSDSVLPPFKKGDQFHPKILDLTDSETQAPKPLTEADLITKMDQNGIGTDATIHEHIKTVQDRGYVSKQ